MQAGERGGEGEDDRGDRKKHFEQRISDDKLSLFYCCYSLELQASKWIFAYYVCPLKIWRADFTVSLQEHRLLV